MGWEPATTYIYDDTGRLVSSQPEPEWDDSQREAMLGLAAYRETEVCPRCGGPKWVCQDAASEAAWEAALPIRCHITTAVLLAQDGYAASSPGVAPQALVWGARRKPQTTASNPATTINVAPSAE